MADARAAKLEVDYEARAERMVSRWAGEQQSTNPKHRPDKVMARKPEQVAAAARLGVIAGHVTEPAREIPILDRCQVLVVGAGPSGLSAAVAARRAGADVMLLERYGCFGGVISTCGMETLGWYRYEGTSDCEGIGREMERAAERMGGTTKWPYNDSPCLDGEQFKLVADRMVQEAGVRPLLHIWVVETIMEGNTVKGVITESKSGRAAILADCVIDCTGDADVAHLAGARFTMVDKDEAMGVTSVFNASGVDKSKFLEYTEKKPATYQDWSRTWEQETDGKENHLRSPYLDMEFEEAAKEGIIPQRAAGTDLGGSWSALSDAGEATNLNLVHQGGIDVTDVRDLTKAEMSGRAGTVNALAALRGKVPGFENAKLRNFSMTIGTRDSRKIIGMHNLKGTEVRGQARFEDAIGVFPEFIDGYSILVLPTSGRYFQVPYGCMVPEGIDNLLVAGRAVAGDRYSHAAVRNMMCCAVTGQGAGVAAAVAVHTKASTSSVAISEVQAELRRQGVRLD